MNAAEIARKMESDAVDFYKKAADLTAHPFGKKMFLSIMEDEKRHIEMIESLLKGLGIKSSPDTDPSKRIKSVFEEMKPQMQARLKATSDEKEALKVAMKMEKEGYEFYEKMSKEAPDEKTRALFKQLHAEEVKHYNIFSNTYSFLEDTGNWFMWGEHSIVEG